MVDTGPALETEYVDVNLVSRSKSRTLVVLDGGGYEKTDFGLRLTLPVEIDGKRKKWRPSRETVENLQSYGADSDDWAGKAVLLQVKKYGQNQGVVGFPVPDSLQPRPVVKATEEGKFR